MGKKIINITDVGDAVATADRAVRAFCKAHKGKLNDEEHAELRKLLRERAEALSKALGTKISSVGD